MAEVASSVVHEVLARQMVEVDKAHHPTTFSTSLADEDFDFGVDGNGAFEAVDDLLVDSICVEDYEEGRLKSKNWRRFNFVLVVWICSFGAKFRRGLANMGWFGVSFALLYVHISCGKTWYSFYPY
ncbi:ABC transporter F family member 3-like isoform X2 [Dioscorea cayenensis subsp. rotundata]|uniref:ABC transporter F family member 3-like isoform X2 n=1 Tax=Dioscorea cayennensis subsp. rotundata TaxID=55577 RepID=A0AB40C4U8_DIOCR|nr:ABC transporter F family member 3-like isoform X2 [Dioscorea cayenensis subsp. rotundata]